MSSTWERDGMRLYHGDCLEVMAGMEPDSVDTVITDPPYGLEFMGKDWDHGSPGIRFWTEALRVAKPGAMLLAFGGTRTHHRLMCAIEDAGWEIRDVIMWMHGSGFPKGHDISKAIDKAAGAEREVIARGPYANRRPNEDHSKQGLTFADDDYIRPAGHDITAPATDAARLWDGWNVALKPAYEPVIVAMKPRDGTFAENALKHGVAGFWVDGCRVATNGDNLSGGSVTSERKAPMSGDRREGAALGMFAPGAKRKEDWQQPSGRWPPNVLLSHTDQCRRVGTRRVKGQRARPHDRDASNKVYGDWYTFYDNEQNRHADADGYETIDAWECAESCPVRLVGEDSGALASGAAPATGFVRNSDKHRGVYAKFEGNREEPTALYGDTGTAARFYPNLEPDGDEWDCADDCPVRLVGEDSGERAGFGGFTKSYTFGLKGYGIDNAGEIPAQPGFSDHGTAARFYPNLDPDGNRFKYCPKAPKREKWLYCAICDDAYPVAQVEDHAHGKEPRERDHIIRHPTQKPLALMSWLVRLTKTPTSGIVLDPFTGTGSTGEACINEGREFIGIEKERPSFITARRRLEWAQEQAAQLQLELV